MQYFINRNGTIHGPFSQLQLDSGVRSGKLTDADRIATTRDGPWTSLDAHQWQGKERSELAVGDTSTASIQTQFSELREQVTAAIADLRQAVADLASRLDERFVALSAAGGNKATDPSLGADAATLADGNWDVQIDRNPMDDSIVFIVSSQAQRGVNQYGQAPTLVLRQTGVDDRKPQGIFSGGKTTVEVFIAWGAYFSEDDLSVTVRIGEGKAVTQKWGGLTDNTGTYYLGDARAFIRDIAKSPSLAVSARPYQENPITAVFDCSQMVRTVLSKAPQLNSWFT